MASFSPKKKEEKQRDSDKKKGLRIEERANEKKGEKRERKDKSKRTE